MTERNRRRFLLATATAATVGSTTGAGATRPTRDVGDERDECRPKRADGGRNDAGNRTGTNATVDEVDSNATESDSNATAGEADSDRVVVEFLDCRRVRIVGDYADVMLSVAFDPGDGAVGTIVEPVGPVDGERTIDAAAVFDLAPETTVLSAVELFATDEVATPGLGDLWAENPDGEACLDERLGHLGDVGE